MRPLYIFDIDGTLTVTEHRVHYLENKNDPHRWEKFYQAAYKDPPRMGVILLLENLVRGGAEIQFWTGRPRRFREQTELWLKEKLAWGSDSALIMRNDKDYTSDFELKYSWWRNLGDEDRQRLVGVFEDRQQVVDMWRCNGVTCFQVAPGKF